MSIVTWGFGDDINNSSTTTGFTLVSLVASQKKLTLNFSSPITPVVSGPAADPTQWIITPLDGGAPITVTAVSIFGSSVVLTTTNQQGGKIYQLNIPSVGITDTMNDFFAGAFSSNFTGVASVPNILMVRSIDARIMEIIFDVPVIDSTASNVSNYTVDNGLQFLSASKITDYWYSLVTTKQTVGTTYTVTAPGVLEQ